MGIYIKEQNREREQGKGTTRLDKPTKPRLPACARESVRVHNEPLHLLLCRGCLDHGSLSWQMRDAVSSTMNESLIGLWDPGSETPWQRRPATILRDTNFRW
jgi:hypothetical protein